MDDQKIENQLNLALDTPESEREKSADLNTGYIPSDNTWTLIVKYNGDISKYSGDNLRIITLLNQYAIVNIKEYLIDSFSALPEIEYIEKPKSLFFADYFAKAASCINSAYTAFPGLSGKGILIAIIDSGIDYRHNDFRNEDGSTRILSYWDQTVNGRPPEGYITGTEFTETDINEILLQQAAGNDNIPAPSADTEAHGTAVAGIAAGNGRASGKRYTGVAFESSIIAVKLGFPGTNSFPRTSELMQAINYCVSFALDRNLPLVINLSFGNNYGGHDGTTLLERFIDSVSGLGRNSIIIGTGNEGSSATHAELIIPSDFLPSYEIEFAVGAYENSLNIQIWKSYVDTVSIVLYTPSGIMMGPFVPQNTVSSYSFNGTNLLVYYGMPSPYSISQEIFLDFIPKDTFIESGIYRFVITPVKIVNGQINMWMPSSVTLNNSTKFLNPSPYTTLTIPSTASSAITVAAYNSGTFTYADFSGRGFTRTREFTKPDLSAPGVDITAPAPGGGYMSFTGTSFATPFVSGSVALMMQWGITDGNDPYLYGEKIKAYLRKGARPFGIITSYPNRQTGYGSLCVKDSIPQI